MAQHVQDIQAKGAHSRTTGVVWLLLLLVLWLVLVEGRLDSLWFAVPVVAGAWLIRRAVPLPRTLRRFSLSGLVFFLASFIRFSVVGGIDVARRAMDPRMPIDPEFITYRLRLPGDGPRVLLAQTISLMPGTLACELEGDRLVLHALNGPVDDVVAETAALERRIARLFDLKLEEDA